MNNAMISVKLPEDLLEAAKARAKDLGISLNGFIRNLLKKDLKQPSMNLGIEIDESKVPVLNLKPSKMLQEAIEAAREDIKNGETISFGSKEEMFDYMQAIIDKN